MKLLWTHPELATDQARVSDSVQGKFSFRRFPYQNDTTCQSPETKSRPRGDREPAFYLLKMSVILCSIKIYTFTSPSSWFLARCGIKIACNVVGIHGV